MYEFCFQTPVMCHLAYYSPSHFQRKMPKRISKTPKGQPPIKKFFQKKDISESYLLAIKNQLPSATNVSESQPPSVTITSQCTPDTSGININRDSQNGPSTSSTRAILISQGTSDATHGDESSSSVIVEADPEAVLVSKPSSQDVNEQIDDAAARKGYKKKVVQLSCVVGQKTIKIKDLQAENTHLRKQVYTATNAAYFYHVHIRIYNEYFCFLLQIEAASIEEENENILGPLMSISYDQKNDATFVRKALNLLYADTLETLKDRSVCGKLGRAVVKCSGKVVYHHQKEPITPRKLDAIKTGGQKT